MIIKFLKTSLCAMSFAAISVFAHAVPVTGILSISDGSLAYDIAGDGANSATDTIFGANDWTLQGSFNMFYSQAGTNVPAGDSVDWRLSAQGSATDILFSTVIPGVGLVNASLADNSQNVGPTLLGTGTASDIFGAGVTDFNSILTAAFDVFSGTPTLTDLLGVLTNVVGTATTFTLPSIVTDIADDILLSLNGNMVSFASTQALSIGGQTPNSASANFGGTITLSAVAAPVVDNGHGTIPVVDNGSGSGIVNVSEPGIVGLLGLGLVGFGLAMRRKHHVA